MQENATVKAALFQAACVAVPKGLGGVLTVALNGVLLTRMTPAEFGVYAICLTLVLLADGILGAAVDMSAIKLASARRLHDTSRAVAIEQWAVLTKLLAFVLLGLCVMVVAEPVTQLLFHRTDGLLLAVVTATGLGVLMQRSLFLNLQLRQRFAAYAGLELFAQGLRVAGVVLVIVLVPVNAMALMLAALAGTVLTGLAGLRIARIPTAWPRWQRHDGVEFGQTLRWMLITFASSAVLARIDVLLLTRGSTIEQVGLFAAAAVFAQIPELLGMYLGIVFSPRIATASATGDLRRMMAQVHTGLLLFAMLVFGGALLALHLAGDLLPVDYARSVDVFIPLLLASVVGMIALPVAVPFIMFVRPSLILKYDLLTLPMLLIAYHFAIESQGALGAAWVSGSARILKSGVLQVCAWMWARESVQTSVRRPPSTPEQAGSGVDSR